MALIGAIAAALAGLPSPPPPAPPDVPVVAETRLTGGAEVRLLVRRALPLAHVELSFATDALVATGRVGAGELEAIGAAWERRLRALSDSPDGTLLVSGCDTSRCWLGGTGPPASVEATIALFGDVISVPPARAGHARWRSTARADWETAWLSPVYTHESAVGRVLWPADSPYRWDRPREETAPGWRAVRGAWARVRAEARATVAIVGDLPENLLLPALERALGDLAGRSGAPPPLAERLGAESRVLVASPGARSAYVEVLWTSPGGADPDRDAWDLVFRALAQGYTSRVNQRLRESEGLTYGVEAAWWETPVDGLSRVGAWVEPSRVVAAVRSLEQELERMRAEGPTAGEISATRSAVWAEEAESWGTLSGAAWRLWLEPHHGRVPGERLRRATALSEVTVEVAAAVAARWLGRPRVWVVTGDGDALAALHAEPGWAGSVRWTACEAVYGGECP